jgi:hypothetical protein
MAKGLTLSSIQYRVLCYSAEPAGAAVYLFPKSAERLLDLGLVEVRNEHSVHVTDRGRRVWLERGRVTEGDRHG